MGIPLYAQQLHLCYVNLYAIMIEYHKLREKLICLKGYSYLLWQTADIGHKCLWGKVGKKGSRKTGECDMIYTFACFVKYT